MKRILLAITVALSLAGCAQLQNIGAGFSLVTASYANPVTKDKLYYAENGLTVLIAGLNAYKQSCIKGLVEANCRDHVMAIQAYTRRIPPLLANVRVFVRNNDQINAVVVYNEAISLINAAKAEATASGIAVGG